jgi:hypothetical protein
LGDLIIKTNKQTKKHRDNLLPGRNKSIFVNLLYHLLLRDWSVLQLLTRLLIHYDSFWYG